MRLLALLAGAALAVAGCGRSAPDEPPPARPALWRATDGARTYWLFGTIHLLPPGLRWAEGPVARAIAASDTLITEIPDADPQRQAAAFLRLGRARGLPPILARVPAGDRAALRTAAAQAGMPLAALDGLATWAAALTLTSGTAKSLGATRTAAPEAVLGTAFAGKRRAALETFEGQLGAFAALSEPAQQALLLAAVRGTRDAGREFGALLAAWQTGDSAALQASIAHGFGDAPELADALLARRNRAWADRLAGPASPSGTALVAVGAGHLVGAEGLPALLSQRGFRVARMQ